MKFIPYNYQKSLLDEMQSSNIYGCFSFPGSGKTVISLETLYKFREPTLVIAPISILYTTWLTEHNKWDFSRTLKINLLHGPNKDENFYKKAGIHLVSPDGIKWLVEKMIKTKRFPYKNLVVDESPRFKNHKSERFKSLSLILKGFKRRYILAGNPIPSHYLDLWSQIYILDLGARLGDSFWKFRKKYFYPDDYKGYNWVLKDGAKEEIIKKIGDICNFLEIDDVSELDLPQRIERDIEFELPKSIVPMYKNMERKLFVELDERDYEVDAEDGKIVASTKAVALLKCWQIANGFVYENLYEDENDEEKITGRKTHHLHNISLEILKEKVEELQGSPCIIAYNFNHNRDLLLEAFPKAPHAGSGIKPRQLQNIEKNWNESKIPVLITHIKKLSHGLNLQYGKGHTIIFFNLTYNYDDYDQLIRRLERQGAGFKRVVVLRFKAKNTIHEAILSNLEDKNTMSSDFLKALYEYKQRKINDV